jgi:hypothetical protein
LPFAISRCNQAAAGNESQSSRSLLPSAAASSGAFEFHKRSQLFIRTRNETLSVAEMCIGNEDCLPVTIHSRNTAPSKTGIAESVGYDFPILPALSFVVPRFNDFRRCLRHCH